MTYSQRLGLLPIFITIFSAQKNDCLGDNHATALESTFGYQKKTPKPGQSSTVVFLKVWEGANEHLFWST